MDNPLILSLFIILLVLALMSMKMWIALALALTGIFSFSFFIGGTMSSMIGDILFDSANSWLFTMIPLFVFMGQIIANSSIGTKLYEGSSRLVSFLPGGLIHTNVVACAIFGAISGSSIAGAATIGSVAIPELEKRNYDKQLE